MQLFYSKKAAPYIFVAPFVISFLLFFAYPVFSTIIMSFQEVLPGASTFVGLDNYKRIWNPDFLKAVSNSTKYTFFTLLILIPAPLVIAVFLNSKVMKFRNFFRAALFIPALTSVVVAGIIFRLAFGGQDTALMNTFVHLFGGSTQKWLLSSTTGMFVLVLLASWRWMGVNLLYFLSALQSIPNEIYEAAEIDGATAWDKFLKITLPYLKPVTIYVLTISIYGGYSMFAESYMLWGGNRSPNGIGSTIIGYIYQTGLERNEMGFGAAVGLILFAITMVINGIQLKFFGLFKKGE
ncbi:MAG TPA: sugar ABC transporter permease [Bacilli bacterium]